MSKPHVSLEHTDEFVHRHIGPTEKEVAEMLKFLGMSSLDELVNPQAVLTPATKLLWFESPINPTLRCVDIAAIADAFDALTTQRVYKPAFPLDHAVELMTKHRGEHFDPELLDVFFASLNDIKAIYDQYADQSPLRMTPKS